MLIVELLIVLITELLTEQRQVLLADNDGSALPQSFYDVLLLIELAGVLQSLVEITEARYLHATEPLDILDLDVEVAHHVAREVVACQLEEQLVLVHRVGLVGNHEDEVGIRVGRQLACGNGIAVAQHDTSAAPHITQVEFSTMQAATFFHTIDNHSRHLCQLALWELLNQQFHVGQTSIAITVVEFAQSADEDELVAVCSQWETGFRNVDVASYLTEAVGLEGVVGGSIKRVFYLLAKLCVLREIRVGQYGCPLVVGIVVLQLLHITVGYVRSAQTRVEQEQMVIYVGHLLELGEVVNEPAQGFFRQGQVVELVFEDDARVEQSVLYDEVARSHLVFGERNLRQIVFALVRVVLGTVGHLCQRVGNRFGTGNGVAHLLGQFAHTVFTQSCYDGLVDAPPVVHILALAPLLLKRNLSLLDGQCIIEVPFSTLLLVVVRRLLVGVDTVSCGAIALHGLLGLGFFFLPFLLLFLLLQRLNNAVDGGIAVFLAHLGERLQRVLQIDGIGIRHQFIEHLRSLRQFLVVLAFLVEQSDGLSIAALGVVELLLLPVDVAQLEQQYALFDAVACSLFVAFLVVGDGTCCVALGKVDVSDGVVHLI